GAVVPGGEGPEANAPAGRVLQAAELVPVGRPDVLPRMCPARPVFRRDVRSLQVNAWDRGGDFGIVLASAVKRRQTVPQRVEAVGHQRREETGDAVVATGMDDVSNIVDAKPVRVETATGTAVDLQIEQRRGNPARLDVRAL